MHDDNCARVSLNVFFLIFYRRVPFIPRVRFVFFGFFGAGGGLKAALTSRPLGELIRTTVTRRMYAVNSATHAHHRRRMTLSSQILGRPVRSFRSLSCRSQRSRCTHCRTTPDRPTHRQLKKQKKKQQININKYRQLKDRTFERTEVTRSFRA